MDEGNWLIEPQEKTSAETILSRVGFAPLPPYIKRDGQTDPAANDLSRYQTVFAEKPGAVAAPTAGLHFDQSMLDQLSRQGVQSARVTLHVGTGTFKPVQTELLEEHPIHSEYYEMPAEAADKINAIHNAGGRIIAIGTTSVRTLEASVCNGVAAPAAGHTRLFITPGYRFQLVDAMVTNFHLPRSTLLALVAAFAGLDNIMNAYRHAIENRYRFYSYGDAMLLL
jgi:S-adenosylmethionine:tRNA ribosyltransferase-isomerase